MTVQQERPTTTAAPTAALPQQRRAHHDDAPATAPAPARQLGAWGSEEDRTMMRWLGVGMVVLSLYASTFVYLGTRVFG